jgi:zona occludens toxin (predicted ATPase)
MKNYDLIPQEHKDIIIEAVRVTATSLNEHVPNWVDLINWGAFVFINYKDCIYGQLSRHSDVNMLALSEVDRSGFEVPRTVSGEYPESLHGSEKQFWDFMEDEWRKIAKKDLTTAA